MHGGWHVHGGRMRRRTRRKREAGNKALVIGCCTGWAERRAGVARLADGRRWGITIGRRGGPGTGKTMGLGR